MKTVTREQIVLARTIAIIADGVQIFLFPLFIEGFISPLNDLLDVIVGLLLCNIMGFHLVLVPTFVTEEFPLLNEVPTWTLAVFYAERNCLVLP